MLDFSAAIRFVTGDRRHATVSSLLDALETMLDGVDLVSFDVFDTLLSRRVVPPDATKLPAARYLSRWLAGRGRGLPVEECLAARDRIEATLRRESSRSGLDHECAIRELLHGLASGFAPPAEARALGEALVEAELDAERRASLPVPGMASLMLKIRQRGKAVVLVSDMYLGRDDICGLLDGAGYTGLYDRCYVSSEFGLCKGTGRLFRAIADERGVEFRRWVHVGDDEHADRNGPSRLGIRCCLFEGARGPARRLRAAKADRLSRVRRQWHGLKWVEFCSESQTRRIESDLRYAVGFLVLGPLIAAFVEKVIRKAVAHDVDLLVFPSRDGFVLHRVFRDLVTALAPERSLPAAYAFLNRGSVYPASVEYLGYRELQVATGMRRFTLRKMLTRLGLDPGSLASTAARCGIDDLDAPLRDPFHLQPFLRFIRHPELVEFIRLNRKERRDLVDAYLQQIGFWSHRRVAWVDVGWHGTVQDALTCAFQGDPRWPRLWGWYLAFFGSAPYTETPSSTYEGIFYDHTKDPMGPGVAAAIRFVELLELATRAPHATVTGLRREAGSGRVVPAFAAETSQARRAELADRPLALALQSGILDFAGCHARLAPFRDGDREALDEFACDTFGRLLRYPDEGCARSLLEFSHVEDFGSDALVHEPAGPASLSPGYLRLLLERVNGTVWPEGWLASTGVPLASVLGNLRRLLWGGRYY